ncbi:MAG TPA: PTS sugar transporter subunit IIA [Candidatus Udaeobacter sp.]|nr:PTS sugar transporter subunit IIA [Candidatus Udaeobacter sp.]
MDGTLVPAALDPSLYIPELKSRRRDRVLAELVGRALSIGIVRHADALLDLLSRRESLGSTSPGRGFAVPAARSLAVSDSRIVVGCSRRGIDWAAKDDQPVNVVALVLSPAESPAALHVDLVARVVAALRLQRARQRVIEAESFEGVAAVLREAIE